MGPRLKAVPHQSALIMLFFVALCGCSAMKVTASVVTANQKGIVSLAKDPRVSDNKVGHVTVTVPSHPGLRADLDIPFLYNVAYTSDFSGNRGMDGSSGLDGTDGISGSMGSLDPNNPSPGGDGSNGSNGSDGHDGDPGGNAPPVDVRVTLQPGSDPLLQVSVSASGRRKLYLVDPKGGSLTVSGGKGGRGGRGGSGGIGTPNGRDGSSGMDGRNGFDGSPGRGGAITVTYDPAAKPFLNIIHLSSRNAPPPVLREAAVAALW